MKLKAILFGAAGGGKRLLEEVLKDYDVVCFTDNDKRKWGTTLLGIYVKSPSDALSEKYDVVVITSAPGCGSIKEQLIGGGVIEEKIITRFVDAPLLSRKVFLEKLGEMMHEKNIKGECAEAGVFQGDFAKYINKVFKDKQLYLFDTFEGFNAADIKEEQKNGFSDSSTWDYANASIEMVLKKMEFPEKCVIRKGYFPETAFGIEQKFCFANLDLDLYKPTLAGLEWFQDKMVSGGVILIHDYFAENFKGPKKAVDEFIENSKRSLQTLPIGDGVSVMVIGF